MHGQAHMNQKKDDVTVMDVTYVTAHGPDVVVYVDAAGNPVSTVTKGQAAATAAPAVAPPAATPAPAPAAVTQAPAPVAAPVAVFSAAPVVQAAPSVAAVANIAAPAAGSSSSSKSSDSKSSASVSSGEPKTAITYSPYNSDGTCKSQSQVNTDMASLSQFEMVRIYGTDCDQVNTVGTAAMANGKKVMAGLFTLTNVAGDTQTIKNTFGNSWNSLYAVSVGNELVNTNQASVDQVVDAVIATRKAMKDFGYQGPVVTVDTFNAVIANPRLCQNSDFAAVNAHPFFDSALLPAAAGTWALATQAAVSVACGGKKTVITESGMPSGGQCNGSMCPSPANQATAISSLKGAFPNGGLFLFTAFNDYWKSPGYLGVEQLWGILGNAPSG